MRSYFQMALPEDFINDTVERLMKDADKVDKVRQEIETDKVFAVARMQVTLVDKPVTSQELHAIFEALTKKSEPEEEELATEAVEAPGI